ncbi:hypothetical protein EBZ70_00085 [bacterium]|nr:hypothetical protein [bacterium]
MKSFLTDRQRVNTPALNVPAPVPFVAAVAAGGKAPPALGRPGTHGHAAGSHGVTTNVECVRQGDRVIRIIVTCACGERIEVDCLYAAET